MLVCASIATMVAQRTISGTVTDQAGEPLIGSSILIKNTSQGTITDIDGNYTLEVPETANTLVFSYTGFETKEVEIGASNVINVTLEEGSTMLNEVVVTGYSEVQRKKLIASAAVVDEEAIENMPLPDINQVIQGRAPGVFVTAPSGQPGAQQNIRIRGTGSISAGRGPLYVIDGVIVQQGDFTTNTETNDVLSNINPNDIANVTVLKDAAATALYGSRGANGVVLITTKRGKVGKSQVTVKGQYGFTEPTTGNFDMMTPQQQWQYERDVLANSGFGQDVIESERPESLLENTTDWVDAAFRTGQTYNVEAQASGGDEKTRFFVSGGYFKQEGTLIESDFSRLSLRSNLDHTVSDIVDISLNLNGSYTNNLNATAGNRFSSPLLGAFVNTPLQSATNPATGELYTGLEPEWRIFTNDNFLYSVPRNPVRNKNFRLLSKATVGINILSNLRFTQTANIDFINIRENNFFDPTTNDGFDEGGRVTEGFNQAITLTTQSILKYYTTFGSNHNFDALAGFEYQDTDRSNYQASGIGLASPKLKTLQSTAQPDFTTGFNTAFSFASVLGQVNYNFAERYYLTASARTDGSSRFGANNRWATFWSVGGSWRLSEEAFLSGSNLLSNLRIRASYGTAGNADIGNFESLELYGFASAYAGLPGSQPSQIGNPDLTWEKSDNFNIGLDFGFWDDRLGGTVEYYNRTSEELLLNVPVSSTTGFTSATQNLGKIQNQGVEVTLFASPIRSTRQNGFNWNIDLNFSRNVNEVLELPDGEDILNGAQVIREGEPIRAVYMERWAGVNPQDGTPQWLSEEGITGDYRQANRAVVGNAEPDWIAGLNNSFSFAGFSLSAFFYTAQGHEIYNNSRRFILSDGQRYGWNHDTRALNYWREPGDQAPNPQPLIGGNNNANARSTRYLEDASFIRLRNVTLGYKLPQQALSNIGVSGVSLYVQGQNLWTQTDYTGFDPEMDENGSEFFRYPIGKSVTFGLDVTF